MDGRNNGSFYGDNNRHFQQQHRISPASPLTRRSSVTSPSSFSNNIRPAASRQQQRRASMATCAAAASTFPPAVPDTDYSSSLVSSSPYDCLDIQILKEIDPDLFG